MDKIKCCCDSGLLVGDCCGPIVAGDSNAATAEALMRSRYTANVLRNTDYLLATWHPSSRPQSMNGDTIPVWCGLTVLSVDKGIEGDEQGVVEFRALYKTGTGIGILHEKSRFVYENGCWFYVDGQLIKGSSCKCGKTGRNSLCPCGSGKKYKKCCLK